MARINLLPWRETLRKKRQRDFGIAVLMAVLVVGAASGAVHFYIDGMIDSQLSRIKYLKKEISAMDRKIKKIKELEKTKAKLLARMNVIQTLQVSRPEVVHMMDEIVTTIPIGLFLTEFKQKGKKLTLSGRAQSNARVSAYMRNIEASKWMGRANLQVISNKSKTGTGLSHFTLSARQTSPISKVKKKKKKKKKRRKKRGKR
ncbi:MAG: PilN domain-containing protein [Gammaproteobacteria bacterium]|nr:PilN domain-containing protein [Gammaproteobacteria bacterium]